MPKSNEVPVFWQDQARVLGQQCKVWTREVCRALRKIDGEFRDSGTTFQLYESRPKVYYDGPAGRGNVLPFVRFQNPLLKPEPLHYPIPACGAHSRFLNVRVTNQEYALQ